MVMGHYLCAMRQWAIAISFFIFSGCTGTVTVPKPRAYPRVIYPEKTYKPFQEGYCDFTFEQPAYAVIERDTLFFEEKPKSDCWFNISVPSLNAKIHCSYYPVKDRKDFDGLVQDAFTMAQKHNLKANYIDEYVVDRPKSRVHGVVFQIEGPAASAYQFFMTDSTRHFLRGALYFNTQSRPDSLAPVVDFMKQDVDRLIETLEWK